MLEGTWKAQRFEKLYEIYRKHRGKRITRNVIDSINELKREMPAKISEEWIKDKLNKLFPEADWAKEMDNIRRMLKWTKRSSKE